MTYRPVVVAVLDGWGCSDDAYGNAIEAASLPYWRTLFDRYPWTTLEASGGEVGLPKGIMGNSEVGHMNIGSGRVVQQGVVVINADIADGHFAGNPTLAECIKHVKKSGGTLHVMGLLSDGQVHSSMTHLFALIDALAAARVTFAVHPFLDGRDVPPRSALIYLEQLEEKLRGAGHAGAIATVSGRFYAMDRDKRWERAHLAYDAIANANSPYAAVDAISALRDGYARGESDEFVTPATVGNARPVRDGDACIFFNFRPDRARQLTLAFSDPAFADFPVNHYTSVLFATMTKYEETFPNPVLFGPRQQFDTFGEIVARHGLRQLRLAETEKYAHVTYFFNGGHETVFAGEDRHLIPSDRSVETYDLAPAMRAREITDYALEQIDAGTYDVIVMNYANADMVGHTGKWEPTIAGVEFLDGCVHRLADAVLKAGGLLAITADHGNAEAKIAKDGNPLTAHTTNRVPFILVADGLKGHLAPGGKLGDIAPTLLALMALTVPDAMTGKNLYG